MTKRDDFYARSEQERIARRWASDNLEPVAPRTSASMADPLQLDWDGEPWAVPQDDDAPCRHWPGWVLLTCALCLFWLGIGLLAGRWLA